MAKPWRERYAVPGRFSPKPNPGVTKIEIGERTGARRGAHVRRRRRRSSTHIIRAASRLVRAAIACARVRAVSLPPALPAAVVPRPSLSFSLPSSSSLAISIPVSLSLLHAVHLSAVPGLLTDLTMSGLKRAAYDAREFRSIGASALSTDSIGSLRARRFPLPFPPAGAAGAESAAERIPSRNIIEKMLLRKHREREPRFDSRTCSCISRIRFSRMAEACARMHA